MKQLRNGSDLVQYCSHVLQRKSEDSFPGSEIGLDNRLFIKFRNEPSRKRLNKLLEEHGVRVIWQFPEEPRAVVAELTDLATENPLKIAAQLRKRRRYRTVEPCLIEVKASRALPSDSAFRAQWHLLNSGQGGGTPGADCNAPQAWDHTWGDPNIRIAIIDDGFDLSHPDLADSSRLVAPYDANQRDHDPSPWTSRNNHGTACAGVAVAARGHGLTVGVAPDCSFMPIRHAGQLGDFEEALAFYHAYENAADVISCSWGPFDAFDDQPWPLPSLTRTVIDICARYGRGGKGIPVFFAAGNGNEPLRLDGYANYKNVIAVGASTNEDKRAWYSDYGTNVWITAPSSGGTIGVFTTDRTGVDGYSPTSDYTTTFGGTSSSTPIVAGVSALMLSVNPALSVSDIRDILRTTAVKISCDRPREYVDYWGNRFTDRYNAAGHSRVFGWGRVDAGAAVREALSRRRR